MKLRIALLYVILGTFVKALSIPLGVNSTTGLHHDLVHCDALYGANLSKGQCKYNINALPQDRPGREHVFGSSIVDLKYRLPTFQQTGYCILAFGLIANCRADVSSWARLKKSALDLYESCVEGRDGIGGFVHAGDLLCIRVTFFSTDAGIHMDLE